MIKLNKTGSYKIGLNEVQGLENAMREALKPLIDHLKKAVYWNDLKLEQAEYLGRDGFIPHSHNCGGLTLDAVIPKCEEYGFPFLEFGEYSEREDGQSDDEYDLQRDSEDSDGHNDARLRVWLKFEGIEDGQMSFYLVLSGGNGDAPYFREKYQATIFESEFQAKNLTEFKTKAKKAVAKLIKAMPLK